MLEVNDLCFKYTDKQIINHANFRLFNHDHAVIVGANGIGKSTFMNLISKNLLPDSGTVSWLPNISYAYLDQHLKVLSDKTIHEYLYEVFADLFEKEAKMNEYYEKLTICSENEYDKYLNRAMQIQDELDEKNFYRLKSDVGNIINGLGLSNLGMDTPIKVLSGGQKAKVFLGKLLLEECDCILLDEPTNFLDITHIEWLTKYLQTYPKSFVVITHDYAFAKEIANVVFELKNGTLERYNGDFSFYEKEHVIRDNQYQKDYEAQQRLIKKTEEFIQKNIVRASTTKQAQSRRKMLEKLDIIEKPKEAVKINLNFPFSRNLGEEVLVVKDLVIGYNKPLLKPLTFTIRHNQKVAIIGHNGIGKSTLLKTINGEIKALGGSFKYNNSADISYYRQEEVYPNIRPIDYVREFYHMMTDGEIRSLLAKVGLKSDSVSKTMNELSGGEQTKVRLAIMMLKKANILIFDEPTNHLDVNSKKELYRAINDFSGSVILVSHDPEFYEPIVDLKICLDTKK